MRVFALAAATLLALMCVMSVTATAAAASVPPHELRETGKGYPECDPGVNQYSGYFDINRTTNKHYFYWAVGPRGGKPERGAPVIMWMTGGPGCSSGLALMTENGPCHMHESNGSLYRNPWSWNNDAVVIYVDQPAKVGYSYSDAQGEDDNEQEVAHDMYLFAQALFKAHPDWQANNLTISGESYGGHFAPATAYRIWLGNKNREGLHINLHGVTIGNGLTNPSVQFAYYYPFACSSPGKPSYCSTVIGQDCIDPLTCDLMNAALPTCLSAAKQCDAGSVVACYLAQGECNGQIGAYEETGKNVYNIKQACTYPPLCYNFDKVTSFFNRASVKTALGAKQGVTWQTCSMTVNEAFAEDFMNKTSNLIPPMLESGIRVLVYNGDLDYICNWLGGQAWSLNMNWKGKQSFGKAALKEWKLASGQTAGWYRTIPGPSTSMLYTFFRVHNAGHLVPMDQPQVASQMINNFIFNRPF